MDRHRIRHVAVTEPETGRLLGLISHRDVLRSQEGSLSGAPSDDQVHMNRWIEARWVMTKEVRTVYPTTPALEAAQTLRSHGYGCVPVVDEGRLVGMLTEADFVNYAIRALSDPGV
jgi:CBS domain-containing membrane protein